ncbi:MAG: hypothetical protein NTX45_16870 [Proteobacteria bacterium]|nr:hypothetical protein [Pseudomonadota bacterium]
MGLLCILARLLRSGFSTTGKENLTQRRNEERLCVSGLNRRMPTLEVEDERLLPREREIILHDIGRLRNQVESILFTQGYRGVPKTAAALKAWAAERGELTPQLRERLGREIDRLAVALWRYADQGVVPEGTTLK